MIKVLVCCASIGLFLGTPLYTLFADDIIERISLSSLGAEGNASSTISSISDDGRYVVFQSDASTMVSGDTNLSTDIFLHDTQTGDTTRVSVDSNGAQANASSAFPSISEDGRYITFQSDATNLVASDTNAVRDIFLHDTQTGDTTRVSVDSNGVEGNSNSSGPQISADGRYIVFRSQATNLVLGDTNVSSDIFLHDTQTGDTTRVSVDSNGAEVNGDSSSPAISEDGRYVTFQSPAPNLVASDTNNAIDIFLHDTQTGDTTRVSVDSNGVEGDNNSVGPRISNAGDIIVFYSSATNLVAGDTNGFIDVFTHNTQTGDTVRVSLDSDGNQSDNDSFAAVSISGDGRYVVFESQATNLVPNDGNASYDIFIHDRITQATSRVSISVDGSEATDDSFRPDISSDGQYIVFHSDADNLVLDDTNNFTDVFLYNIDGDTTSSGTGTTNPTSPHRSRSLIYRMNQYRFDDDMSKSCPVFTEYLRFNDKDVSRGGVKHEVAKLQQFLMDQGFSVVKYVDGIFGHLTRSALIAWQNRYAAEVLNPWESPRVTAGTGNFFKSSRRWANMQSGCVESVILDNGVTLPEDSSQLKIFY